MHQILIILIIHIIVSYDQNISLIFLCESWIPCLASTSVLCLHYRPETVHCSTKDAYNETTFLALHPCCKQCTALICNTLTIENRIYIRGEFKESLGMNLFSPFQSEREFKVYKSFKCLQIICSRIH